MPIYWFHIDLPNQPHILNERLRSIVRGELGFKEYFQRTLSWQKTTGLPFIGRVQDDSFSLRRDIRGRNSFLPRIRGHVTPTQTGTRISVLMFIHPFVAFFTTLWLGIVGYGAFTDSSASAVVLWAMFAFGVGLTCGCFFPEAIKAKRLLSATFLNSDENSTKR